MWYNREQLSTVEYMLTGRGMYFGLWTYQLVTVHCLSLMYRVDSTRTWRSTAVQ